MNPYAAKTSVTVERSKTQIELLLKEFKASAVMMATSDERAMIVFTMAARNIKFVLPLPQIADFDGQWKREQYAQATRTRWRALYLALRAKLEMAATVLSLVFAWGRERGFIQTNPASDIKTPKKAKDAPEANRPWSDAERDAALAGASRHFKGPLAMMMFCGLDPGDVASLPRAALTDTHLDTKRGKTAEPVWFQLPAPAREILATAPRHEGTHLFPSPDGSALDYWALDRMWRPIRAKMETDGIAAPGLTLKGLRHTVGSILGELGWDGRAIADFLGQKTVAMGEFYSRRADKRRKTTAMVLSLNEEVKRRTKKQ